MSDQDRKIAQGKVAEKIKEAEAAIKEATEIASAAGIGFNWEGPAYGMGGYFEGRSEDEWEESGWSASSQSC